MKSKLLIVACLIITLVGCQTTPKKTETSYKEITNKLLETDKLATTNVTLSQWEVKDILSSLSSDLKNNVIKKETNIYTNNYSNYVGQYLSFPLLNNEDSCEVTLSPFGVSYDTKIDKNRILFRSIYQGKYELSIYSNGQTTRKIIIVNKLKTQFTEQENYDFIFSAYKAGNLKGVIDGVALHRIAFPNSFKDKQISFMLIELASNSGNLKAVNEELKFLQKNVVLETRDKIELVSYLKNLKNENFSIPEDLLDYQNPEIINLIVEKNNITQMEIEFLEKYCLTYPNAENKIKKKIADWYFQQGNEIKGNHYLNQLTSENSILPTTELSQAETVLENQEDRNHTQYLTLLGEGEQNFKKENYLEAVVFFEKATKLDKDYKEQKDIWRLMGEAQLKTGNYDEAIKNLKKGLKYEKDREKTAELYYNIGLAYDNLGNKEEAAKNMIYIKQHFKNSPWSVKSGLYLLQENK